MLRSRRPRKWLIGALATTLAAFLALLLLYPLGLQALILGGLRDLEVSPPQLTLYLSNRTVFCYEKVLEVKSLGGSGLAYELAFSLEGSPEFFSLALGDELLLTYRQGNVTQRALRLEPGSSASLTVCAKAPSPGSFKLRVFDPRFREATETLITFRAVETDWWRKEFSRRLSLLYTASEEGIALFEVTGSGEVYVNGRLAGRVHELRGVDAGRLAVVYVRGGVSYLLPFQVEAWERRGDMVVEPRGLRSGAIGPYDRLVFAAYVSNETRVDIYVGGRLEEAFPPAGQLEVERGFISVEGLLVRLDSCGFAAPGLYVNLSGRIAFPYQVRLEYYSDWGDWRPVAVGPVRAIAAFNTSGLSGYAVEAFLMVWGLKLNVTQLEVWLRTIRRGIVLDWAAPLIEAENATVELICGTACNSLPLRLEPWGVKLCENYWQPGDHRFGYFTLLFKWSELGSVKSVRSRLSSFPGG
ncbi:MAG: hypothetical protein QXJ21_02410 [Thermofilum sp.]